MTVQKRDSLPKSIVQPSSGDGAISPSRDAWTEAPTGVPAPQPSPARSSADSDWDPATLASLQSREAEYRRAQKAVTDAGTGITSQTSGAGFALGSEQ
jgi:hypothetical protein